MANGEPVVMQKQVNAQKTVNCSASSPDESCQQNCSLALGSVSNHLAIRKFANGYTKAKFEKGHTRDIPCEILYARKIKELQSIVSKLQK